MTDETILRLAAVRRVATRAGAIRFNAQIGSIIGAHVGTTTDTQRSATLARLLSLYNQMRAAKLYGQDDQFERAKAEMNAAITAYSQESPQGADKIRAVVQKLTFSDEAAQRKASIAKANKANTSKLPRPSKK